MLLAFFHIFSITFRDAENQKFVSRIVKEVQRFIVSDMCYICLFFKLVSTILTLISVGAVYTYYKSEK